LIADGWGDGVRLISAFLLAPQAIDFGTAPAVVRSVQILGFASDIGEIWGFQPKAIATAASIQGFKGPHGPLPPEASFPCAPLP
jgi:hypothetical protein